MNMQTINLLLLMPANVQKTSGSSYMITETGELMITEAGDKMITES